MEISCLCIILRSENALPGIVSAKLPSFLNLNLPESLLKLNSRGDNTEIVITGFISNFQLFSVLGLLRYQCDILSSYDFIKIEPWYSLTL
jgi:hypothetical protein